LAIVWRNLVRPMVLLNPAASFHLMGTGVIGCEHMVE
jgi:hypothetical protein